MSKKDLERAFLKLKEENEKLKEENAYLKFRLEELQSKRYKSKKIKPPDDTPLPRERSVEAYSATSAGSGRSPKR